MKQLNASERGTRPGHKVGQKSMTTGDTTQWTSPEKCVTRYQAAAVEIDNVVAFVLDIILLQRYTCAITKTHTHARIQAILGHWLATVRVKAKGLAVYGEQSACTSYIRGGSQHDVLPFVFFRTTTRHVCYAEHLRRAKNAVVGMLVHTKYVRRRRCHTVPHDYRFFKRSTTVGRMPYSVEDDSLIRSRVLHRRRRRRRRNEGTLGVRSTLQHRRTSSLYVTLRPGLGDHGILNYSRTSVGSSDYLFGGNQGRCYVIQLGEILPKRFFRIFCWNILSARHVPFRLHRRTNPCRILFRPSSLSKTKSRKTDENTGQRREPENARRSWTRVDTKPWNVTARGLSPAHLTAIPNFAMRTLTLGTTRHFRHQSPGQIDRNFYRFSRVSFRPIENGPRGHRGNFAPRGTHTLFSVSHSFPPKTRENPVQMYTRP